MELYLIGLLVLLISIGLNIVFFKSSLSKGKKIKTLNSTIENYKKNNQIVNAAEKEKTKIREKYNEKKHNVLTDSDIDNILQIVTREHNHPFDKPCSEGCPLYGYKD